MQNNISEEFRKKINLAKNNGSNLGVCVRVKWRNTFLLLQRSVSDSSPGIWEMPGGSVAPAEEVENAAIRELFEETGISVSREKLMPLGIIEFFNTERNRYNIKFAFSVDMDTEPEITLSNEHDNFLFLSAKEIESLPRENRDKDHVLWETHYKILSL